MSQAASAQVPFPIVAVGASAGGLAPTVELLRGLGPAPGVGLVVIHHLDPTHDSSLVEILSRATPLPVAAATDGVAVQPNHVYVLPPNASLSIEGGVLKVRPRAEDDGPHLPIDRFCEALAVDRDGLAVGVVLSGSGFDGAEGLRAIKKAGGITLAQDGSATFAGMPESAVRTGCVDFIASPSALARELVRIGASAALLKSPSRELSGSDHAQVLSVMSKASGVDFANHKQSTRDYAQRSLGASDVHREADRLVLAEFGPPGVVVSSELAIVQFRGQTGPFLEPAPGVASLDLLRMAREELRLPLRRALDQARSSKAPVTEKDVILGVGDQRRSLSLRVAPFAVHSPQQLYFLVLFEDSEQQPGPLPPSPAPNPGDERQQAEASLRQELTSTRQYLESIIEQAEAANEELKAANEEIVSSNEELQSAKEELQSAKEELQATNEELRTVNDEMSNRTLEAVRLSDDLSNIFSSVELPILLVGADLLLRRFTPAAAKAFGIGDADLGRALNEVRQLVSMAPTLMQLVSEVREQLAPSSCSVQDARGAWLELSLRPYVSMDRRIDGTVIVARDIDAEKRAAESVAAARKYAEDIVESMRDGLVVLDADLRVRSANRAFLAQFQLELERALGKRLNELGHPELADTGLQAALAGIDADRVIENARIELRGAGVESRVYLMNGHVIDGTGLRLLAFQDVTEGERARQAAKRAELLFGDVLTSATEGILIVDRDGQIRFANPAAGQLFGYQDQELHGLPVERLLPEALRDAHVAHRSQYLAKAVPRPMGRDRSLVGLRKDGTEVPIEVSLSPMAYQGGLAVVAFVTDITDRRDAERNIQAYQARLQRMRLDAALTEEHERRRIAVGLHDQVGQALALAQIKLSAVRNELPDARCAAVNDAVSLIEEAINAQRSLVFELSPPVLYDLGLGAALAWLAEDVEKRHGLKLEIVDDGADKPLDDSAKAIVFRAVRELVMNVLKHAQVPTATVSLRRNDQDIEVDVIDRGLGFDPGFADGAKNGPGFGLLSVREQIRGLGGTLRVESAPQRGAIVTLSVPLQSSESMAPSPTTGSGES